MMNNHLKKLYTKSLVDGTLNAELFAQQIISDCVQMLEHYDNTETPRYIAYLIEKRFGMEDE
jgi:hypothetical protein